MILEPSVASFYNRTEIYIENCFEVVVTYMDRRTNGIIWSIRLINRSLKVVLSIYIVRTL